MSFVVSCQCGKQFRVADEQMGKKSRCKGCGAVLHLVPDDGAAAAPPPPPPAPPDDPFAQGEDDPFASVDWNAADAHQAAAPPPMPARASGGAPPPPMPTPVGGPKQKACPSCGAIISAFALRCEHCGANLSGAAPLGYQGKPAAKPVYGAGSDDSDLTVVDWLLCILCSGIGCIVGIVYLIQGKPKGGKMIGISLLVGFISGALRQYLRQKAGTP